MEIFSFSVSFGRGGGRMEGGHHVFDVVVVVVAFGISINQDHTPTVSGSESGSEGQSHYLGPKLC